MYPNSHGCWIVAEIRFQRSFQCKVIYLIIVLKFRSLRGSNHLREFNATIIFHQLHSRPLNLSDEIESIQTINWKYERKFFDNFSGTFPILRRTRVTNFRRNTLTSHVWGIFFPASRGNHSWCFFAMHQRPTCILQSTERLSFFYSKTHSQGLVFFKFKTNQKFQHQEPFLVGRNQIFFSVRSCRRWVWILQKKLNLCWKLQRWRIRCSHED